MTEGAAEPKMATPEELEARYVKGAAEAAKMARIDLDSLEGVGFSREESIQLIAVWHGNRGQ